MATVEPLHVINEVGEASVLLNPMRLEMLARLHEPDSASGLARELGMPRQRVNYHLRELEKAGLVKFVKERKKGNCMERVMRASAHAYVISPKVLGKLGAEPGEIRDRFSSAYLMAVAAQAIKDVAVLRGRADEAGKRLATATLQTEITFNSADDLRAFTEELTVEVARLSAKYQDEKAPDGRAYRVFLGSYPKITK